jgi:tetratricopeptide (TPR) repeat protein
MSGNAKPGKTTEQPVIERDRVSRNGLFGFVIMGEHSEFDKAIADFNEAVRLNPRDPNAYLHRGYASSKQHQYDKAVAGFSETIRLSPKSRCSTRGKRLPSRPGPAQLSLTLCTKSTVSLDGWEAV